MKPATKITFVGAGSILILDITTSLLIAHFNFPSSICFLPTLVLYFVMTYWAAKHLNLLDTLTFGAFLGLVDVTIGWQVCCWLGAEWALRLQKIRFSSWCGDVILVLIFGAFMAFVAFVIATRPRKQESK